MPRLIGLYEDHIDHRDKFEIIAIHDSTVKDLQEMDKLIVQKKQLCWQGKDLPFPIVLDDERQTEKLYHVESHPTSILIDPEGNVVGEFDSSFLEFKLPKVSAAKKLERFRDMYQNTLTEYRPNEMTLKQAQRAFSLGVNVMIEFDEKVLKEVGHSLETKLPIVVRGTSITVRSLEHIILAPMGLRIVEASDETKLTLAKFDGELKESKDQIRRNKSLKATLDGEFRPIEFDELSLFEFVKTLSGKTNIPVAADTKAILDERLDLTVTFKGTVTGENLGMALKKYLEAYELTYKIQSGILILTPQ